MGNHLAAKMTVSDTVHEGSSPSFPTNFGKRINGVGDVIRINRLTHVLMKLDVLIQIHRLDADRLAKRYLKSY
jgi:hypothetical protein